MNSLQTPTPLRQRRQVLFSDADPAGIVFFAKPLAWAHEAFEILIRHQDLAELWYHNPLLTFPIVHSECSYQNPLSPGLEIFSVINLEFGETSLKIKVQFCDSADKVYAKVLLVHVCVNKNTHKPIPYPQELLEKLNRALALEDSLD